MTSLDATNSARAAIEAGRTSLGIELGSTRIKAVLVDADTAAVLAAGGHEWENTLVDGLWTYSLEDVWRGLQAAYAELVDDARTRHGVAPTRYGAMGVSAMMHGYLAFGQDDELLVPFRTWRNTNTQRAARELTDLFETNIPLRWSIAHLRQAVLDEEEHTAQIASITTLAGYVHWRLTGHRVLGVGDASGMFPIDSATGDYDADLVARFDGLTDHGPQLRPLRELLPSVLVAGQAAGELTDDGARLLDPTGALEAGVPFCPPEGDAGTGMVATESVRPRTGNVSAGTSIFAMVVLEEPLTSVHEEIDLLTTPAGHAVAMVHCNNGASELGAWAGVFRDFAAAAGTPLDSDTVYRTLFRAALEGEHDAGGVLAYNQVSGEPVVGIEAGRPLVVRTPDSTLSLPNLMRAHLYGVFASLALGMRILDGEGVTIERMFAHGGVFRTEGVAQRFLAAALNAPVAVGESAAEGGAWGIAVLASYLRHADATALDDYLHETVFAGADITVASPRAEDATGFAAYLDRYEKGLVVEAEAGRAL